MQKRIGGVIFVCGLIALALWARFDHVERIQTQIANSADQVAQSAALDVRAEVVGRDIFLTGTANSLAEQSKLISDAENVTGRRHVNSDRLFVLKTATPFVFNAQLVDGGMLYSGNVPDPHIQDALGDLIGEPAASKLEMAQGVPQGDWLASVTQGLSALSMLEHGTLAISDNQVSITGEVSDFDIGDEIAGSLVEFPQGFDVILDLTVPDTTPFVFEAVQLDDGLDVSGLVPDFPTQEKFSKVIGDAANSLQRANGMPDEHWPDMVLRGLTQLDTLSNGFLRVTNRHLVLSGTATDPLASDYVHRVMQANLPAGYQIDLNVEAQIISPYVFEVRNQSGQLHFTGLVPSWSVEKEIKQNLGVAALGQMTLANGMPDIHWPRIISQAISALDLLNEGTLVVSDRTVTVKGLAANPDTARQVQALLANLPTGYQAQFDLDHADDGRPLEMEMIFTDTQGAVWSGKAPNNIGLAEVTAAMGATSVSGGWVTSTLPDTGDILGRMASVGDALKDFETATVVLYEDKTSFTGVLKIGRDVLPTTSHLAQTLGINASVSVLPNPAQPKEGEERMIDGAKHVFRAGVWVRVFEKSIIEPVIDTSALSEAIPLEDFTLSSLREFSASYPICTASSEALLSKREIKFENGSAELKLESQNTLDDIAVFVGKCIHDADLRLEIGGHTDDQGDDDRNQTLSTARAMAVLFALTDRGIEGKDVSAQGFGKNKPIADNTTLAGRNRNQRITFRWIQK